MFVCQSVLTESKQNHYHVEASDLALTPAMWPSKFHTDIGNGLPLLQEKSVYGPERNLVCVRYRQHLGVARVEIYND